MHILLTVGSENTYTFNETSWQQVFLAFIFKILRSNGSVLVHRCGRGARQLQEVTDSER